MHARGVYNRDIKLENILVDNDLEVNNSANWFKLADFGMALIAD